MAKSKTSKEKNYKKEKGLGRGLDALINPDLIVDNFATSQEKETEKVYLIDINSLSPNPNQPRKRFDDVEMDELTQSIKENGILQPILAVKQDKNDYIIVAGERRWRAARKAGFDRLPVIVRDWDKLQVQKVALIENINRKDLNPIEEAEAFRDLLESYGMTQEELSRDIGRSRPAIANILRLLKLPAEIKDYVIEGKLSAGHARAILSLPDTENQMSIAEQAIAKSLSVRETEKLVYFKMLSEKAKSRSLTSADEVVEQNIRRIQHRLTKKIGTKVRLRDDGGRGKIIISYSDLGELQRLLELFGIKDV